MLQRAIQFFSEGYRLEGTLYLPDDYAPGEQRRAIIANSGYKGFNEFYPRLFAGSLTAAGFVCLGFDYRGFAASEGLQGRVLIDEQVQDIRNALTFLQAQPEVDPQRIGLIGWGMGAANVVLAAAADSGAKAVAGLNGFFDGARWLRSVHSDERWKSLVADVAEDRHSRVTTGRMQLVDPFLYYPLDPITERHVQVELAALHSFSEQQVSLQFTESVLEMNAEQAVASLSPRPLFIAHGVNNRLHPLRESEALYRSAKEPKQLHLIDGQHNDFMYGDHPEFRRLMGELARFFGQM